MGMDRFKPYLFYNDFRTLYNLYLTNPVGSGVSVLYDSDLKGKNRWL